MFISNCLQTTKPFWALTAVKSWLFFYSLSIYVDIHELPKLWWYFSCIFLVVSHGHWGAGIAQWLERRTRHQKVAGSKPCKSSRRISFSRVTFLCWLLLLYPFHPHVTTVAYKDPGHSAKSAVGRLQLNTHAPYICGFAWSDVVHGCMVYTERTEMAAVSCGTSHASAVSPPLRWIFKNVL